MTNGFHFFPWRNAREKQGEHQGTRDGFDGCGLSNHGRRSRLATISKAKDRFSTSWHRVVRRLCGSDIRKGARRDRYECLNRDTGVATLTFLSIVPRPRQRNVRVKATPESHVCQCPFGSDIRKSARRDRVRMSEPGHWCGDSDVPFNCAATSTGHWGRAGVLRLPCSRPLRVVAVSKESLTFK